MAESRYVTVSESMLRDIIRQELQAHVCRFPITDEEARQVGAHLSELAEIGGGNILSGLHEIRDNHRWMSAQRQSAKKATSVFIYAAITAAGAGAIAVIWAGAKIIAQNIFGVQGNG